MNNKIHKIIMEDYGRKVAKKVSDTYYSSILTLCDNIRFKVDRYMESMQKYNHNILNVTDQNLLSKLNTNKYLIDYSKTT